MSQAKGNQNRWSTALERGHAPTGLHRGVPLLPLLFAALDRWPLIPARAMPAAGAISDRMSANICRDTVTLGYLERDETGVACNLCADLDQLLRAGWSATTAPPPWGIASVRMVARVVGQRMEREADGVGGEGAARQPGPFDRALAVLIGIGGHLAVPPLPHHRAYGSRTRRFD